MAETARVGPANRDEIIRFGQEAWTRLKTERCREDWFAVAEAIQEGRRIAMIAAKTNQPRGSLYDSIFGDWLKEKGFDAIDKGDRKRLLDCLANRAEIETWLATLPEKRRLQVNHPNPIWRGWNKTKNPTQLSHSAKLRQEVVRLEEENRLLRSAVDDLFSPLDSAADIAWLLADRLLRLSPNKLRQVVETLPRVVAERSKKRPVEHPRNPAVGGVIAARERQP
jgi:hypothetical protein